MAFKEKRAPVAGGQNKLHMGLKVKLTESKTRGVGARGLRKERNETWLISRYKMSVMQSEVVLEIC